MFARTALITLTLLAATARGAPAPGVDAPVSVSVPVVSGNTGGNSNDILSPLPIIGRQLDAIISIVGGDYGLQERRQERRQAGVPVGSVTGLVEGVIGDVEGILNGPV